MPVENQMVKEELLRVDSLSCMIESKAILQDISFTVSQGDYLAIVGPNGAGKTTLLRCLNRLVRYQGAIKLRQRAIESYSRKEQARQIAYVQQITSSLPFTVREYLMLSRYPHLKWFAATGSSDECKVNEAIMAVGLSDWIDRPIDTLSGGERQKVFLAAALVQEPQILLLDEPTTYLDYRRQKEIHLLLRRLHRTARTTMIEVTHDLNHAALHSDRILALAAGRIAFFGPPTELMNHRRLESIFETPMQLANHPETGMPMVVPSVEEE